MASATARVVLAVGLPGAGKSTWLAERNLPTLSSDHLRRLLSDDPANQSINSETFEALRYLLDVRLRLNRPLTYIDATNLTLASRRPFIALAKARGCRVEALVFDVPLETCLERNLSRQRRVPEDALRQLAADFQPPTSDEGFDEVFAVEAAEEARP